VFKIASNSQEIRPLRRAADGVLNFNKHGVRVIESAWLFWIQHKLFGWESWNFQKRYPNRRAVTLRKCLLNFV